MPGPAAPAGSSEYTFLQDLRDALLPFIALEHADNVALNATVQLLNLQAHTDQAALLAAVNAAKAQAHTDSVAVLNKLEAVRLLLLP